MVTTKRRTESPQSWHLGVPTERIVAVPRLLAAICHSL
jgi:hypothetical protein